MPRLLVASIALAAFGLMACAPDPYDVTMRVETEDLWDLMVRVDPPGDETHYNGSGLTDIALGTWDEPHCVGGWVAAEHPAALVLLRDNIEVLRGAHGTVLGCILRKGAS